MRSASCDLLWKLPGMPKPADSAKGSKLDADSSSPLRLRSLLGQQAELDGSGRHRLRSVLGQQPGAASPLSMASRGPPALGRQTAAAAEQRSSTGQPAAAAASRAPPALSHQTSGTLPSPAQAGVLAPLGGAAAGPADPAAARRYEIVQTQGPVQGVTPQWSCSDAASATEIGACRAKLVALKARTQSGRAEAPPARPSGSGSLSAPGPQPLPAGSAVQPPAARPAAAAGGRVPASASGSSKALSSLPASKPAQLAASPSRSAMRSGNGGINERPAPTAGWRRTSSIKHDEAAVADAKPPVGDGSLIKCPGCERTFALGPFEKHERICAKARPLAQRSTCSGGTALSGQAWLDSPAHMPVQLDCS